MYLQGIEIDSERKWRVPWNISVKYWSFCSVDIKFMVFDFSKAEIHASKRSEFSAIQLVSLFL